jgi:hypothetical protein
MFLEYLVYKIKWGYLDSVNRRTTVNTEIHPANQWKDEGNGSLMEITRGGREILYKTTLKPVTKRLIRKPDGTILIIG